MYRVENISIYTLHFTGEDLYCFALLLFKAVQSVYLYIPKRNKS